MIPSSFFCRPRGFIPKVKCVDGNSKAPVSLPKMLQLFLRLAHSPLPSEVKIEVQYMV